MDGKKLLEALLKMAGDDEIILRVDGKVVKSIDIDLKKPVADADEWHVNIRTEQTR